VGISHGLFCLGCCWALMTVLVLIGLMSLGWMAAAATIFMFEKNLRYGMQLTRVVGATVIVLGLAVVLGGPEVLSWLSGPFLPPSLGGYI
jgi:predicted metal-binding membrane protein